MQGREYAKGERAYSHLLTNPIFRYWHDRCFKAKNTQDGYCYEINKFLEQTNLTIDEFLSMSPLKAREVAWNYICDTCKNGTEWTSAGRAKRIQMAFKHFWKSAHRYLIMETEDEDEQKRLEARKDIGFEMKRNEPHYIPRLRKREKHIPTHEKIWRLVDKAKSLEVKAIILLLYNTGMRLNALEKLTFGMVKQFLYPEPKPFELTVSGKLDTKLTLTQYPVHVDMDCAQMLRDYCDSYGIKGDNELLFHTRSSKKLQRSRLWRWIKETIISAGLDPSKTWLHCIRGSFRRTLRNAKEIDRMC